MNRHMTHPIAVVASAISLLFAIADAHAVPIARLMLESEPGDFIGQGETFDITYTPDNSRNFRTQIVDTIGLDPVSPTRLLFVLGTVTSGADNTFALLSFGTDQLGIPIQPGFFPDAERAPFASPGHPGLDVSFQNRGSNTLTGSFTIFDVAFVADPFGDLQIATFDAEFEQHSEGRDPALFGRFRFNLEATPVPEPSSFALLAMGLAGVGFFRIRDSRSS